MSGGAAAHCSNVTDERCEAPANLRTADCGPVRGCYACGDYVCRECSRLMVWPGARSRNKVRICDRCRGEEERWNATRGTPHG